jgi:hypothetical protein
MKAEKVRKLLDGLDCQACGRHAEISTKGICAPSCGSKYRLDDEIKAEIEEIKRLAEIGAMVEKWNSYPHKKVVFKTYLGDHGEIVESINTAMAKYRESQTSGSLTEELQKRIDDEGAMGRAKAEKYCNQREKNHE